MFTTITFPEEQFDSDLDFVTHLEGVMKHDNPASQYIAENRYGSYRKLSTESIVDDVARWVGRRVDMLSEKIKSFTAGYNRLNNDYNTLPEIPVFITHQIGAGNWAASLMDEGEFDPSLVLNYSGRKQTLGDSAKELLIFADRSAESGFSKSLVEDRMKRAGLDRNTAMAFRLAKIFSLSFVSGQIAYTLPGGVLLVITPERDGCNSVKWRKINLEGKIIPFFKLKNEMLLDPVSEEDWDDYKDAVKHLLALYQARIKGHQALAKDIEKLKASAEETDGAERKRYLKEMNGAITIEEAFTISIKRSLEGLLAYMRASIK